MPKLNLERLDEAVTYAALRSTPQIIEDVLDTLIEPAYLIDRSHRLLCVNLAYCDYVDRQRSTLIGNACCSYLPAVEARRVWESDEQVFQTGEAHSNELVLVEGDRQTRVLQTQKSLLGGAGRDALLLGVIRDITGTEAATALLRGDVRGVDLPREIGRRIKCLGVQQLRFAFADPLTQLPNRRVSMKLIETLMQQADQEAAIFVINIDHFNLVNDRFGYAAGDTVILAAAARLKSCVGDQCSVGRLDNDAFIVIADGVDDVAADRLAERLLESLAKPLLLGDYRYRLSVSMGIATHPQHGRSAEELFRNATTALRWSKRRRRGHYQHFSETVSVAAERRAMIELKLLDALERDLLCLNFQAIVDGARLEVAGFEALTRWHDVSLGYIQPSEFIPVAEDMGLCRTLAENVFESACSFIAEREPSDWFVSVNISSSQLLDETFPIFVAETLQRYDVPGDRLILEITETVAMEANPAARQVFHELSGLGLRLFVDDFGTGFSNLARLRKLPFTGIKIDREFVRDIPASREDIAIFEATCAIAEAMQLAVVVEGIETAEQAAFMAKYKLEYLQGYRFGYPKLPSEITTLN